MDVARLTQRAEEFYAEMGEEYFANYAGLSDEFRIVEIVDKYPELFSRETYDGVMALKPDGIDERELKLLRYFVTGNYFTAATKHLVEEKEKKEATLTVEHKGEELAYRSVPVVNANEEDAGARRELDAKAQAALGDELDPLYAQIFAKLFSLTDELGYANYTALTERLTGLKLGWLRDTMREFIRETDDLYREALDQYAWTLLGLRLSELAQCDIGRLMRADAFDPLFDRERMVPTLKDTLWGMHIELDKQENVTLDLESRPKKSPRAFCIGIRVPQDVRLVLTPVGGAQDYSALFHEAGHLQFYAHMNADLPFLYRHEGDTSVHENFAFLLQYLTTDPAWLEDVLERARYDDYVRFSRFTKLYMLRRYAAKLDYEYGFWPEYDLDAARRAYREKLTRTLLFKYSPTRALADFDQGYYVAKYLQAWLAEATIRRHLRSEFGERWYRTRQAGDWLREVWAEGQKYDIHELLARFGLPELSYKPALEDIREHLG
jgi:hypothetical protein